MYVIMKVIHLSALAAWLGPAFGGYWLLITLGKNADSGLRLDLEKRFEQVVRAEHGAFLVLLTSGIALLQITHWQYWGQQWFSTKLTLIAGIVLIEAGDYVVSNYLCQRLLKTNQAPTSPRWQQWQRLRFYFYTISVPLLAVLVPWTMMLAVGKPG